MKYLSDTLRISCFGADAPIPRGSVRTNTPAAFAACRMRPNPRHLPCKLGVLLATLGTIGLGGGAALAQTAPVSIFGTAVPPTNASTDTSAVTLGVKFWSSQSGTISAIRFYRGAKSLHGYIASLYSASGTLLGSVTMATESGSVPGWQVAKFASPIPISPNTTYVAAYYAPSGQYTDTVYGLTNGVTTGPLTAPASATVGGNGVFVYAHAFPNQTYKSSNYYTDVLFTPSVAMPYLKLSFNPANPSIPSNAPAGTVVATVTASWSDGSPFTGTLSFGTPYSNDNGIFALSGSSSPANLVVSSGATGLSSDAGTIQSVTITAKQ